MNNELTKYPILRVDWVIILLYLILIVCGWMSICGATHEVGNTDFSAGAPAPANSWYGLAVPWF